MTDSITQTITDTILVDLGVKAAPVAPSPKLVPLPSGNAAAREAEAASAQLWATYMHKSSQRKTVVKTPITSRHVVPVEPTAGAWEKDSVLNELERMRGMYVDFRTSNQARIKTKDFESIVGVIGSDMLNCVEQAGFIVNGGASIDTLKTLISVWLSTHCKQLHEGAYVPVVVKD